MSALVPLMAEPKLTRVVRKSETRYRFELHGRAAHDEIGRAIEAGSWTQASQIIAANPTVVWLTKQQAYRLRSDLKRLSLLRDAVRVYSKPSTDPRPDQRDEEDRYNADFVKTLSSQIEKLVARLGG